MNLKMKRLLATVLLTIILLPVQMSAQEYTGSPVEISKEKVKVDGKVCFSHIVLEKQTLYSISKAYGVTVDDIYRFNPSLHETGLKKNSIIIIPSQEALSEDQPRSRQKDAAPETEAAQSREEDKGKARTSTEEDKKEQAQRIHITKWTEDLDVIAEKYGVSVEAIMAANNLKGRKLSRRQKLIIPYPEDDVTQQEDAQEEKPASVPEGTPETAEETKSAPEDQVNPSEDILAMTPKQDIDVSLILPLTGNDGKPNKNNIDFYCGSLLAIYDLGNKGVDCKLNVYDIMDKSTQISIETINNSDMVIGPISSADLTRLFNIAPKAKTIISPLDPRAEKLTNSRTNMIQIPTPASVQYKDMVNWIEEEYNIGDKVIMISEKGARQNNITAPLKQFLDSSTVVYTTFAYSILEGRDVAEPLTRLMTREGKNRMVITSESEAFVNDVIRNLNLLIRENLDIVLYSPSKIRTFDTIEVDNLHNLMTRVCVNYYIDYDDPEVREFLMKYRALYNTEPTQFAFQGYDIAMFCMSMCSKYGDNWMDMLDKTEEQMLQNRMNIKKDPFKGYVNNGVRRIVYGNGYSIITVR